MKYLNTFVFCAAIACAACTAASADDVGIVPTTVTLRTAGSTSAIEVSNNNPIPVIFQARILAWQQTGTSEELVPSTDVRISPPIFTVAPGATQIVRLGARDSAPAPNERAYRLFIKEVPNAAGRGISMPLQFNLPVFIAPAAGAGNLAWSIRSLDEHRAELAVVNTGSAHEHIVGLRLNDSGAGALAEQTTNLYVLAGATRVVVVPIVRALSSSPVRVVATRSAMPAINAPVSRSAP